MKANFLITIIIFLITTTNAFGQASGKPLPAWTEGEMEIHHISTGRGEAVFCVFPDGTTMIIDAGDIGNRVDPRVTTAIPNSSKQPGEWIARYITQRLPFKNKKQIDYVMLTHFHDDHMGTPSPQSPKTGKGGDYLLCGLPEVAEYLDFKTIIDRDWPEYNYPKPLTGKSFENYYRFVKWNHEHGKMEVERFIPGTNKQFVLKNNPEKYAEEFEIRNIVANGEVWTGVGDQTRRYFPDKFEGKESVDENKLSAGVRISYSKFDYYNGGDVSGKLPFNSPAWRDIERRVGEAVGPVEVCEANHHAWIDAMSDYFVSCVQPQVFILQVWHVTHLGLETIRDMSSKGLYQGERHIIPTQIPQITKDYIGQENIDKLTGDGGHIVIKILPGGNSYSVYILNDENETLTIKSEIGPFECR